MPCYEPPYIADAEINDLNRKLRKSRGEMRELRDRLSKTEAMLCGLAKVIPLDALKKVDWDKAGVSIHDYYLWLKEHEEVDSAENLVR